MSVYWYDYWAMSRMDDVDKFPGLDTWISIYKAYPQVMNDRAGRFATPIVVRSDPSMKIPEISKSPPESFEHCCLKRAEEIFALAEKNDKPIYLHFSGGLDSTAVAVSFMRVAPAQSLRHRLKIITSTEAWVENPNFVRDHLIGKFEFLSIREAGHFFDGRAIVVNGHLSEFNALNAKNIPDRPIKNRPADILYEFLASHMEGKHAKIWTRILNEDRANCPIELPTLLDWMWWVRFNWGWQCNALLALKTMTAVGARISNIDEFHTRMFPFFGSEDFQLWMLLVNKDRTSSKKVHRAFIRSYTHDDEWCDKKQKFHSFNWFFNRRKNTMVIDQNFKISHSIKDALKHYDPRNDFIK